MAAFTDATELFGNMSDLNVTSTFQGYIKKIADEGGRELTVELGLIQHVLNSVSKRLDACVCSWNAAHFSPSTSQRRNELTLSIYCL